MLGKKEEIIIYGRNNMKIIMKPQAKAETVMRSGMQMTMKHYKKRRILRHPLIKRR